MNLALLINFFCCSFMTGLIWLIQCVHYPSFTYVPAQTFAQFSHFHSSRITFIVLPVMMIELATSCYLTYLSHSYWLLLVLNILLFLFTFFLSVPCHGKLGLGKDDAMIKKLVLTNWPRTILWSARSALLLVELLNSL